MSKIEKYIQLALSEAPSAHHTDRAIWLGRKQACLDIKKILMDQKKEMEDDKKN